MIQLTDELYYNNELPFEQQTDKVKEYLNQYYYSNGKLIPPQMLVGNRYDYENGYTLYDEYKRPVEIGVRLGNINIVGYRTYIDASTAWKLHQELITVKINQL